MNDQKKFEQDSINSIQLMSKDEELKQISRDWIQKSGPYKYAYNWKWLGLPIIQLPPDILLTQEIIWDVAPTVIIETGIARGGSTVFNASQLALLDICEAGKCVPAQSKRRFIGIDIDIRSHNRRAIEAHPLSALITLYEGSSVDPGTIHYLRSVIREDDKVLVILDSNHTHDHVAEELRLYSELVSIDSFLIVHDTGIEFAEENFFSDRDWGKGNNPLTALREFLSGNKNFEIAQSEGDKLLITSSPQGYIRRVG